LQGRAERTTRAQRIGCTEKSAALRQGAPGAAFHGDIDRREDSNVWRFEEFCTDANVCRNAGRRDGS
jgi:hypothetical protein